MQARFRNSLAILTASATLLVSSLADAALVISNKPTRNVSCTYAQCSATAPGAILNAGKLSNLLAKYPVVYIEASVAKTIDVEAPLGWTANSVLYFSARNRLNVNKTISVVGKGGINISASDLVFAPKAKIDFWDLKGALTINSQSYTLVRDITSLAADITADPSGNYALAWDYDASADGSYGGTVIIADLQGTFEGLGHSISNFTISSSIPDATAALLYSSHGTIADFSLLHARLQSDQSVQEIAPLVTSNYGLIKRVFVSSKIDFSEAMGEAIGGIVGGNSGKIENSHAVVAAAFPRGDRADLGGLAAANSGTIQTSYVEGKLLSPSAHFSPGGIVGQNYGIVKNCYALARIKGGERSEQNPYAYDGGLVGDNGGSVTTSYAAGKMEHVRYYGNTVGGLVGFEETQTGGLAKSYWDMGDGVSDPAEAAGNIANDPGGTGLTDAQLKSGLPDGFDPKIWAQDAAVNNGYPYLIDNPPAK